MLGSISGSIRRWIVAACLLLHFLIAPYAMAQDEFPNSPGNNWAYSAILKFKRSGALVTYPIPVSGVPTRQQFAMLTAVLVKSAKCRWTSLKMSKPKTLDPGSPSRIQYTKDRYLFEEFKLNLRDVLRLLTEFKVELLSEDINVEQYRAWINSVRKSG